MRLILSIFAISGSLLSFNLAQAQSEPDQNAPSCASSPAVLQTKSETLARVQAMGGIETILGTWQLSGIPFKKDKISFDFDNQNFYVQTGTDLRVIASLCVSDSEAEWIRISVHTPGCPENKNIYIKSAGTLDRMKLRAYATRAIGAATFKKIEPRPLPPGVVKPPVKCAGQR